MPLTIRAGESIGLAITRLARAQLQNAIATLNDDQQSLSERVHEMRTSIKKVRALIALAHPAGGGEARAAHHRLREIAARTGELRDAEVAVKTWDQLFPDASKSTGRGRPRGPTPHDPEVNKVVRARLVSQLRAAALVFQSADENSGTQGDDGAAAAGQGQEAGGKPRPQGDARGPRALAQLLSRALKQTGTWAPADDGKRKRANRRSAAALARMYRRARRAMRRAYQEGTGTAFHDWRKAVKAHRYQLQFLMAACPETAAPLLPDLGRLGDLLGDEHDLTVLEGRLLTLDAGSARVDGQRGRHAGGGTIAGDGAPDSSPLAVLARRRQELRDEARPLGERLFAERPRVFRRRLRAELRRGRPAPPSAKGSTGFIPGERRPQPSSGAAPSPPIAAG